MAKATRKKPSKPRGPKKSVAAPSKPSKSRKSNSKTKDYEVKLDRKEPRGLFAHIWEARRGLAASFEAQVRQGITEERLLAYVSFACFMGFLAGLPSAIESGRTLDGGVSTVGLVAGRFVAFVIFAPLFLYGLAGLSHWISVWAFGGAGDYPKARMALFWALVLGVPLGLFQAVVLQALTLTNLLSFAVPFGILIFLIWLWIWASFLALAENFSRVRTYLFMLTTIACIGGVLSIIV